MIEIDDIDEVDPYKDFVMSVDMFDWSDEKLTPESVGKELMGVVNHWDRPEFMGLELPEIERKILFDAGRRNWSGTSEYGKPYYQHFLILGKLLFPTIDITPALTDAMRVFCLGIGGGRKKVMNLIGSQNCLAPHTPVRMFDGSVKAARDVERGDQLVGQDSTPRNVTTTCQGTTQMYLVRPKVGEIFEVTENHLITVICKRGKRSSHGKKDWIPSATEGKLYDFTAKEIASWPTWKQDSFGLISCGVTHYPEQELPIDPRILGIWMGDGTRRLPHLTTADPPIAREWTEYFESKGAKVTIGYKEKTAQLYRVTSVGQKNEWLDFFRQFGGVGERRIPKEFLRSSESQRLELLSGLIDTDGHLATTYYSISSSYEGLTKDIVELAQSLGFRVSCTRRDTNYVGKNGELHKYNDISICGDITRIPVRLPRHVKQAPVQGRGVRKHGVTGFTVEPLGLGPFAGFEVDGDHRFLLGDYTLTHNSSKSFSSCFIAFVVMFVDPERTAGFVASPFDVAADAQIWGTIEEFWDLLCEAHPNTSGRGNPDSCIYFPNGKKFANRQLEFIPGLPKAGTIVLRGVKHVGKFKGTKARAGQEVDRGVMLLIIDEINEVENPAFLEMINNLVSQEQFFAITSQNFKSPEDMGGRITEPSGKFGGKSNFDDLEIDGDQLWHSVKSSITLRFDGHLSPNIKAQRDVYPQLFKMENLRRMRDDYGVHSPDYYSQVRSFPIRGEENSSILSSSKLGSSRHLDTFFSLRGSPTRVAFLDPAFGGGDKPMWGYAEFGPATVTNGEGEQEDTELFVFKEAFHQLKLERGAVFPGENDNWKNRMLAVGISIADYTAGAPIGYEDQMAIQCRERNVKYHIPDSNFGFDFSMRPDIVSSIHKILGFGAVAFDYNMPPEGVKLRNINKSSSDVCKNRTTELAMLAADMFLTRQVRGGAFIQPATTQLSRSTYTTVNRKYTVIGKKEYKAQWQQVSPDHRDVLLGLCGMAIKRGFRQADVGRSANRGGSIWSKLNQKGFGKSRLVNRI